MSDFSVTILGNNSAIPAYDRHPTSQYISLGKTAILLDCGEGTQSRITQHKQCKKNKIEYIFITHLHGDHWLGLMGLLNTFALNRRTKPLHIIGHRALQDSLRFLFQKMNFQPLYLIYFHLVPPYCSGKVMETREFVAHYFPLDHRIATTGYKITQKITKKKIKIDRLEALGVEKIQWGKIQLGADAILPNGKRVANAEVSYPFAKEKSYAFCSDTRYNETILPHIQDATLAYIESTYTESEKALSFERYHCTAKEAAKMALKANVKQLIIGHFSSRYKDVSIFQKEAREIFSNTELAIEGTTFQL